MRNKHPGTANSQAIAQGYLIRCLNSNYYSASADTSNTREIATPQDMRDRLLQTPCTVKLQLLRASREEYPKRIADTRALNQRKAKGAHDLSGISPEMELYIQRMKIQEKAFKRERPQTTLKTLKDRTLVKLLTADAENAKKANEKAAVGNSKRSLEARRKSSLLHMCKPLKNSNNRVGKSVIMRESSDKSGKGCSNFSEEAKPLAAEVPPNSKLSIPATSTINHKGKTVIKCKKRRKCPRRNKKQKVRKAESVAVAKPRLVITAPDLYTVSSP
eukprot:TRINITY_DN3870_c0_g1_i4.p1 TRINITY_DN3870_c0_g1~~TRINITY_DN3870_c0_g1_i4.p1  ORF type:complete len:274 (-),score=63.69 TRINITY_DN3870_c0_g1_i4:390-1211(-)